MGTRVPSSTLTGTYVPSHNVQERTCCHDTRAHTVCQYGSQEKRCCVRFLLRGRSPCHETCRLAQCKSPAEETSLELKSPDYTAGTEVLCMKAIGNSQNNGTWWGDADGFHHSSSSP